MHDLQVGQLVRSIAGHDINKNFVVLSIINDQYVYISDGYIRKVSKPKKKKIKHLKNLVYVSQVICNKLQSGKKITDGDIREFLKTVDRDHEREV